MIQYNRLMEHMTLTPEAETRILAAARAESGQPTPAQKTAPVKKRSPAWKRMGVLAACFALMVCCLTTLPHILPQEEQGGVTINNEMEEYATLEGLAEGLPFSLEVPTALPEGYAPSSYVKQFGMAQVIWSNGVNQLKFYMRDQPIPDVAGGYAAHETVEGVDLYGSEAGWLRADWTDGTYHYSLVSLEAPFTDAELLAAVQSLEPVE